MIEDAKRVRAFILERFGRRTVDIYHARLIGNRASFERVNAE
jgi:hypothetical protein